MSGRAHSLWVALALGLAALEPVAWAAADSLATDFVVEPPESPLRCLKPAASELPSIVYPPELLERRKGGLVRVRLSFTKPDAGPKIEVFYLSAHQLLVDAVTARVTAYRLPCLSPGAQPVVATQEFQFDPDDGRPVFWSDLRDERSTESESSKCFLANGNEDLPRYPDGAENRGDSGVVYAEMRFDSSTQPPVTRILFDGHSKALARSVLHHVSGYRATCTPPRSEPLVATQAFEFVLQGEPVYVLRDLTLRNFVGAIDDLQSHRVRFDFGSMVCPFEVKVALFQPYADNRVGEIGASDPNRREFIEWLKRVTIRLPKEAQSQLIGQTLAISVPCGELDLL